MNLLVPLWLWLSLMTIYCPGFVVDMVRLELGKLGYNIYHVISSSVAPYPTSVYNHRLLGMDHPLNTAYVQELDSNLERESLPRLIHSFCFPSVLSALEWSSFLPLPVYLFYLPHYSLAFLVFHSLDMQVGYPPTHDKRTSTPHIPDSSTIDTIARFYIFYLFFHNSPPAIFAMAGATRFISVMDKVLDLLKLVSSG